MFTLLLSHIEGAKSGCFMGPTKHQNAQFFSWFCIDMCIASYLLNNLNTLLLYHTSEVSLLELGMSIFAKMIPKCHHLGEKLVALNSECGRVSFYTEMVRLTVIVGKKNPVFSIKSSL